MSRPHLPGAGPRRHGERLFQRLAEAQDVALAEENLARLDDTEDDPYAVTKRAASNDRAASGNDRAASGNDDGRVRATGAFPLDDQGADKSDGQGEDTDAEKRTRWTTETPAFERAGAGARRGRRGGRSATRTARAIGAAAVAVVAAAAVALFVLTPRKSTLRVQVGSAAPEMVAPVPSLVADARADLPLRFSDGSTVTFRAGSAGRMESLTGSGAAIVLERGALEAHVIHAATTAWIVRAGPYRVRVTGTRFAVSWGAERLDLALYEGSVIVDGAVLGAGVPLTAGRRLTIASGIVRIEPFQASSTPAGGDGADVLAPRLPDLRQNDHQDEGAGHRKTDLGAGANATEVSASGRDVATGAGQAAGLGRSGAGSTVLPGAAAGGEPLRGDLRAPGAAASGTAPGRTLALLHTTPAHDQLARLGSDRSVDDETIGGSSDAPAAGARGAAAAEHRRRHGHGASHASKGDDDAWLDLAERGLYPDALAVAKQLGWSKLCRRLDAHRLLALADVARYSGAPAPARRAFEALARRFPHDRLAGDAVFSLGRLAFEAGRPAEATAWFQRYGSDWPNGPLADEAAGRLVESAIRVQDAPAARAAARAYLSRAPHGPQASLARGVLADP